MFSFFSRVRSGSSLAAALCLGIAACSGGNGGGTPVAPIAGSASPTPAPTATPTASASPTIAPTLAPSATPLPSATPVPTVTPTFAPSATPVPSATPAPTATPASLTTAANGCPEYPSGNVIADAGAESAVPAADGSGSVVPVPAWTASGDFSAVQYSASGFTPAANLTPPSPGANYFVGGTASAVSTGTQLYTLPSGTQFGTAPFEVCGWFGGFSSQDDNATLTLDFLDNAGQQTVPSLVIGGAKSADRGGNTGFIVATSSGNIPFDAVTARFTLTMTRVSGTFNDGYADNLDFSIGQLNVPATGHSRSNGPAVRPAGRR